MLKCFTRTQNGLGSENLCLTFQGTDGDDHDDEWYIDNGCSRHMTSQKKNLRNFRKLSDGGMVVFGNNQRAKVKGYGEISNGPFKVKRFAYVRGLKHNLISVSQLCIRTGNKVTFDQHGLVIKNRITKEVLLRSKRNGELYPLDMTPIFGIPSICLLTRAQQDLSWLWDRRLSHLNFILTWASVDPASLEILLNLIIQLLQLMVFMILSRINFPLKSKWNHQLLTLKVHLFRNHLRLNKIITLSITTIPLSLKMICVPIDIECLRNVTFQISTRTIKNNFEIFKMSIDC